jgi:hypothetical protein
MSEWTKQRLDQMIADGVEETLSLDYKRADSLAKTDGKKAEVTKDVSSFANSSGGLLIYGIAEFADEPRKHLPERLDPIQRSEISKEWLDQVIQTIQPRIEGVVIHPVTISEPDNTACYVVEVPQSHTAHMARDHRYHKRHNFTTAQMEDYEVRDVMSRRTHPKIRGYIFVNRNTSRTEPLGVVLVRLENVGTVMARDVMVELQLPLSMNGDIAIKAPSEIRTTNEGRCHVFRLPDSMMQPVFPGSDIILRREFRTQVIRTDLNGNAMTSARNVRISIFADEMPPIRATLDIAPVLLGWTPVRSENHP